MLLPFSCHGTELSDNAFVCNGEEGALGFLDLKTGLLLVGLQSGEQSGLRITCSDVVCEEKSDTRSTGGSSGADQVSVPGVAIPKVEKSTLLNLRGLHTGLENWLVGALFAGILTP
ncbi:hypothetical protein B296_00040213 [Ensete ventricosum]|uniref:Uncharacterized protein n=1 Tax=Ensete ventricosum TaxID=4639 RepID=A0A426ZN30_ENSVE|nr:hypothetical protein B296_00040213 [Ensete ventricosum]